MSAVDRLQRDLPLLRIDGTIKIGPVLRLARAERSFRRTLDGRPRSHASCWIRRVDRVRADMAMVRARIAKDRAFWSVKNEPTHAYEIVRVEAWGHVWHEPRLIPAPAETPRKAA